MYSARDITKFSNPWTKKAEIFNDLEKFAKSLGWYPSDIVIEKSDSIANGHLFVEHGMDNSAVISFLKNKNTISGIDTFGINGLLNLSYNNLIDYHLTVDKQNLGIFYNRIEDKTPIFKDEIRHDLNNLRSDFCFDIIENKRLYANIPSLDSALIDTISYWRRIISMELSNNIGNEALSNLFNAIIFCRAIEDLSKNNKNGQSMKLLEKLFTTNSVSTAFEKCLFDFDIKIWPEELISKSLLEQFNSLSINSAQRLFSDFYNNKFNNGYIYDFSIISKHALSKIYERYVALLKVEKDGQQSLFPTVPIEQVNKPSGTYYTPQFIARFFARYIENATPDFHNREIVVTEPAVGSGIFLRTFLEIKNGNKQTLDNKIRTSFKNIVGVDKNKTACDAAKLSLTLLHLVTYGRIPEESLNIIESNAIDYFKQKKEYSDIVISNPPFVAYNLLSDEERDSVRDHLNDLGTGKLDLYFSFLKIGIDILKEDGLGLFVLPNTFLISESAKRLRNYLVRSCRIEFICDLSNIDVFNETGIYPILLIFRKINPKKKEINFPVKICQVNDNVGNALYDVLFKGNIKTENYIIYNLPQSFFKSEYWYLQSPETMALVEKLSRFSKLNEFAKVRTGFASGLSEVFTIKKNSIPKGEEIIFIPYLADREMDKYKVPSDTELYLFYPFYDNKKIPEIELKNKYPVTYSGLLLRKPILSERAEVKNGKLDWFMPNRPRKPDFMMVKKIVTPHLIITTKFSVDINGKFGVSRSPYIVISNDKHMGDDMLLYLTCILNSAVCSWFLFNYAPKYQNGYAMLEPKYLNELPIPDPQKCDKNIINQLLRAVKERLACDDNNFQEIFSIEKRIDDIVASLFNLSNDEMKTIGVDF